ncbi:unnamed protein product, partial [Ascophyllum nodosum]
DPSPDIPPKKVDLGLQSLMEYGDNLEEFIAICAHLPAELKRDLDEVSALNQFTHSITAELSRDQTEILERAKAKYRVMTRPEQVASLVDEKALERAREKRRKVDECVSEKVSITKRMYDALDTCIKNIDEAIDGLEKDVKETYGVIPDLNLLAPQVAIEAKKNELEAAAAMAAAAGAAGGLHTRGGGAMNAATAVGGANGAGLRGMITGADGSARRDDSIAANEPVYCICRQVGWGDMIGCDNEDCEHGEWFHYHCVGLENVDQDLSYWLCPGCTADAREKERREQLEMIRATKAKKAALKLAAVKLPENIEGDDGSTQEQDDDVSKESAEGEIQKAEETVAGQGSRTRERNVSSVGNSAKPAGSSSGSERPLTGVGSPPVVVAAIGKSSEEGATRGLVAAAGGVEASLRGGAGALSLAQDQHQPQSRERGEQTAWIGLGGLGGNTLPG